MLKIARVENESKKYFAIAHKKALPISTLTLTLFKKSFRITYSSKFNYFYMSSQVHRNRILIDALAKTITCQLIQQKTGKQITRLERINSAGHCADYYFTALLNGHKVFIKVLFVSFHPEIPAGSSMTNEYEKGMLVSSECPYFLHPLYYIQCDPCEILILPYIENHHTLSDLLNKQNYLPLWIDSQIQDAAEYLASKRLVHRDIYANNIVIGNLEGKQEQVFMCDLAFMTTVKEDGSISPIFIEKAVHEMRIGNATDDAAQFRQILDAIKAHRATFIPQ